MTGVWKMIDEKNIDLEPMLHKSQNPEYLHWKNFRFKSCIPDELTPEQAWTIVKLVRRNAVKTAVIDTEGKYFRWNKSIHYDELLHDLDLNFGGRLIDRDNLTDEEKKGYISRGLIEEAIASAQLEGAHTTREVAKKMIEEGIAPQDTGQRMIVNNYKTMKKIEENFKHRELSYEMMLELHVMLTEDTLDKPDQVGRFRRDDEDIYVGDDNDTVAYVPPEMAFVDEQIQRFIQYANDALEEDKKFIHPIIKAIILHFWMGFLHPFADGNGRMARAIFYWYLLKRGYWTFSFIPVSTRIKKSPIQYAYAYLFSEQDDNDLTYFIDYNLRKINLARNDFREYIRSHSENKSHIDTLSKEYTHLNHRQLALINYFRARPNERTNLTAMVHINGVSKNTAINDLQQMAEEELLTRKRVGKYVFYYPTEKLLNK